MCTSAGPVNTVKRSKTDPLSVDACWMGWVKNKGGRGWGTGMHGTADVGSLYSVPASKRAPPTRWDPTVANSFFSIVCLLFVCLLLIVYCLLLQTSRNVPAGLLHQWQTPSLVLCVSLYSESTFALEIQSANVLILLLKSCLVCIIDALHQDCIWNGKVYGHNMAVANNVTQACYSMIQLKCNKVNSNI